MLKDCTQSRKSRSYSTCASTRKSAATEIISRYDQLSFEVHKQLFDHHPSTKRITKGRVEWKWSEHQQKSFQQLKDKLSNAPVLTHFSDTLPLKLDTDASQYDIGAVISHVLPYGEERPIAYASHTLSKSERNYSQIEKEALSIIFGVKKFHQYLYGRKFLLVTDHKPLTTVLGPKSGIPTLAAARLQRWALLLKFSMLKVSRITFVIVYGTVFLFFYFLFFSKVRSASFTEMHVRLNGRFHLNSTLLKGGRRAKSDRILKNSKPNQYTYAKNKNRLSVNCAVAKIYLTQTGMMNGYY